jgi:hypothetical protein
LYHLENLSMHSHPPHIRNLLRYIPFCETIPQFIVGCVAISVAAYNRYNMLSSCYYGMLQHNLNTFNNWQGKCFTYQ